MLNISNQRDTPTSARTPATPRPRAALTPCTRAPLFCVDDPDPPLADEDELLLGPLPVAVVLPEEPDALPEDVEKEAVGKLETVDQVPPIG